MKFRKIFPVVLAVLLLALPLAGCAGGKDKADDVTIRVGGLAGPTSIGLVKLMEDNEAGKAANKYEFSVDTSPDVLTPKLVQGNLDIAALPANLASVLYNNTDGRIQLLAINTLGMLYILTKNTAINTVSDLAGKNHIRLGQGRNPEFSLRYILSENGLDPDNDVNIEWKSEHSEVVAALSSNESGIALLPQPFITIAQNTLPDLDIALDLTEEWNKVGDGTEMLTGVLVVRREFAEAHPTALAAFLDEYAASTEFVNKNISDAAQLVGKFNIFNAAIAEAAIPHCNITFIGGLDMKPLMEGYLSVLYNQKPASVGGRLPDDDFYYVAEVSD